MWGEDVPHRLFVPVYFKNENSGSGLMVAIICYISLTIDIYPKHWHCCIIYTFLLDTARQYTENTVYISRQGTYNWQLMLAVRLVEHLSVCLDTELAPVNILASLVTFLLGHSLATLVWNTFTVLLGDGLAVLLGHRSNKGCGDESPKLVIIINYCQNSDLQACLGSLWHTSLGTLWHFSTGTWSHTCRGTAAHCCLGTSTQCSLGT